MGGSDVANRLPANSAPLAHLIEIDTPYKGRVLFNHKMRAGGYLLEAA